MSDAPPDPLPPGAPAPVGWARRFGGLLGAWSLLFASSPGVVTAEGSGLLAAGGVAVWGAFAARPAASRRRLSVLLEWSAAAVGCAGWMAWAAYVFAPGLLWIGYGQGLYVLLGGALLRRMVGRVPLPWAVALAWVGAETLRTVLAPPFGLGWLRLGHVLHPHPALVASARVWGVEGLSLVVAAAGGWGTSVLIERRRAGRRLVRLVPLALGALPAGLAVVLGAGTSAPAMRPGPRLLVVQPGFSQARKQFDDPLANYRASRSLTFAALAAEERRGAPPPDLVCWGESMLYVPLFEPSLRRALEEGGLEIPEWRLHLPPEYRSDWRRWLDEWRRWEDDWVRAGLFGQGVARHRGPRLPEGTSFLSGAETVAVEGGELVRLNAVVLYDAQGRRSAPAAKRFLVPGAETMLGLERFEAARGVAIDVAAYVPDFAPAAETGVLELATRDGERYRFSATVCFDNAFFVPYGEAVAAGPLDFHLVVSNEAWYRGAFELDQMLAFSRVLAVGTGRSLVRATNSGLSVVLDPDGRELARVRDESGRDRDVPGTALVTVPVPAESPAGRPPYVALRTAWRSALVLAAAGLALARRRSGNPAQARG